MHGYARGISAIDGSCSAGFHESGVVKGKWTSYKSTGEFAKQDGLYEGRILTNPLEIHNFNTRITKIS